MHAIVYQQERCEACLRAQQIENARLAWRDLYNMRNINRTKMNFHQLVAYGAVHFDSQALCFVCQDRKTKSQASNSQ